MLPTYYTPYVNPYKAVYTTYQNPVYIPSTLPTNYKK